MTWFEIRVELHGCDDYDDIHDLMDCLGAKRTITADDGQQYELPRATYFYECDWTQDTEEVRDYFVPGVTAAWPNYGLLVTRTDSLAWRGLKRVVQTQVLSGLLGRR